jgi:magnesium transporter
LGRLQLGSRRFCESSGSISSEASLNRQLSRPASWPPRPATEDLMLTAYARKNGTIRGAQLGLDDPLPDETLWIDLREPTSEERHKVNQILGIEVPTREEMQEIEISSRLYQEAGAVYMTATLMAQTETDTPVSGPATFVLAAHRLVTLRYLDSTPFRAYVVQIGRSGGRLASGEELLGGLLDAVVDRIADNLERVQHDMDSLSSEIFARDKGKATNFEQLLRRIGRAQVLTSRARESLVSLGRLITFLGRLSEGQNETGPGHTFSTLSRDIVSLSDHSSYLSNNINFLLDATLGLINNEQTNTIKIFSVAAVVFLPPTLIASVYGMNFKNIPELNWALGYPLSLVLMVASIVGTYWFFKIRKWL